MSFQECLYRERSISDVINAYTEELKASGDVRNLMNANKLLSYQNMVEDKVYLQKLRAFFTETYELLDQQHPNLRFSIEGRRKSLISLERKIQLYSALGKPLDLIRDCFAFRIILFGDDSLDLIEHCYKITGNIIDFAVTKGFTPCDRLPLIGVANPNKPTNDYFENFEYKQYIKDYICFPKDNGYQSIHLVLVDTQGRYLEIQIRTLDMHMVAEAGAAKHYRYKKKKYTDDLLPIEREKINIHGYSFFENCVFDHVGLERSLVIFKHQKTF